ncbi:WAT1-related protein At1g21890-like [Dioscorea cayenensis subsp. rotundata]|uniref:WAT1-related protein n=1 Tax=Dioscorea cayennensis subsp. rotundata TaxID=55577 RepID=A0AB40D0F1_DIOCR|nr:WAT1-related protein At1g21890-like [Dioscorea cayenensis subsp. rotundata]
MSLSKALSRVKPYLAMILLQVGFAGMYIISLASLKHGMNHYVLVVYRNIIAAAVIAPFALWFERTTRPKMTFRVLLKILAMGLLEPVLDQNLYYMGANATSAGFASAMFNILPAITFILAIILRIEKVKMKSATSQAKLVGTVITVVGALVMILYMGPTVKLPWTKSSVHRSTSANQNGGSWLIGTFLLLGSCVCWSGFFIVQSNTLETYTAELSLTTLICLFGAMESSVVALVMARGTKPWSIGFDTRLFTAAYSGIVCSGIAYYVQGIVMKERGPVFVTAFNPMCMIITAILGTIILAEEITLGRVIGAIIIVIGLYALLWGKSKDHASKANEINDEKGGLVQLPITTSSNVGKL